MSGRSIPADGAVDRSSGAAAVETVAREALGRWVGPGDRVTVALSGGLDSVVLLHLLRFPLRDLALRVRAAHLDHGMRPGSDADAAWVRGLCTAWRVPLQQRRADPAPGSEAQARRARYEFLTDVAGPGGRIVTAHHMDDQAETVLLNAVRGTGLRGLRGIAPRRGPVLRPLLGASRAQISAYARAHGITWRTDPTNLDLRYRRNRMRHRILPALETVRPGTARRLARLAHLARRWERRLRPVLEEAEREATLARDERGVTLARPVLQAYHPTLTARLLRRLFRRYGSAPDRAGTHAALEFISAGPSGGELHVRGNIRLQRDFDRIRVQRWDLPPVPERPARIEGPGPGRAVAVIGGSRVRVRWSPGEGLFEGEGRSGGERGAPGAPGTPDRSPGDGSERTIVVSDPTYPLVLRGWRPGDRIRFDYGRKKLKKLWTEHRLDRHERRRVPILVDGHGRVVWVVGLGRATGTALAGPGLQITVEHGGTR